MGASLAVAYSGLASIAKLGTQCLKKPTNPRNDKISAPEVGGWSSLMEVVQSTMRALEVGGEGHP